METNRNDSQASRRDFIKGTAKKAAWAAPTLTLLMAASSTPARATGGYGGGHHTYGGGPSSGGGSAYSPPSYNSPAKPKKKPMLRWFETHRGRMRGWD